MLDRDSLLRELNSLNIELNDISSQVEFLDSVGADYEQIRELLKVEHSIRHRVFEIQEKLVFLLPPVNTNGIIDLRRRNENSYFVCLHGTDIIVGDIQYRGYHISPYHGDVGYAIEEKYRGNRYAYQALVLLSEILYEDGITDFWVSVYNDNIPSIKVIERYGGILVKNENKPDNVNLYMCETQKKFDLNTENNKKI